MNVDGCSAIVEEIRNYFDFLLAEDGFHVEHIGEFTQGSRCLVVLQNQIRLKFIDGEGGMEMLVGNRDAPISMADKFEGVRYWFQLWIVIRYVAGDPKPTTEQIMEFGNRALSMGREEYLDHISKLLKPALQGIEDLLSVDWSMAKQEELEHYCYGE